MKKILFLIYNLDGGGAEKVLMKVLEKINKTKYEIDLFLIKKEGIYLEYLKERLFKNIRLITPYDNISKNKIIGKIQYKIIHHQIKKSLENPKNLRKYIQEKYDVGIAFLEGMSTIYLSELDCRKKIAWAHVDLEKHRTMSFEKEREVYKKYNKIVCVSETVKSVIEKLYPETKNKLITIYNPIDKEEIVNKSFEKIEDILINKPLFISVGRLEEQKGFDILLKAVKKLKDEGLRFKLLILGEGSERKNLENYIEENNLKDIVNLCGFKKNPYPYIKLSDIFILSSRYEGYSLVVAEAMCLEKAIISTCCAGPNELLENGQYGLMVKINDIEDLASSMRKILLDKKIKEKYSLLSKERAKIFNINKIIKNIEEILD